MGVTAIWEHMNRFGKEADIEMLRDKTITIDGHIWLFESVRGSLSHGRAPSYMATFFKRCLQLREYGVEPIVVFDGVTNDFSSIGVPNKLLKRSKRSGGKGWNMSSFTELSIKIESVKQLLGSMGVRVVIAKEDGEAQCAQLELAGLSNGCITQDFDYFLYGGSNLFKVDFSRVRPTVMHFPIEKICEAEQGAEFRILSRNRLIALAMLLGNDYFEKGIEKVGYVSGVEIVSEFSIHEDDHPISILDRFRSYSTREIPDRKYDSDIKVKYRTKFFVDAFPDGFPNTENFLNCVNIFLVPDVYSFNSDDVQLPDKQNFDRDAVSKLMEQSAGWDRERFDKELVRSEKRLNAHRNTVAQTKITNFFPGKRKTKKAPAVAECAMENGENAASPSIKVVPCSRREWAALSRLRKCHLEYSSMSVESQNVLLTPPETPTPSRRKRAAPAEVATTSTDIKN